MELISNIYDAIKAYLWEGTITQVTLVCHSEDHSDVLDLAQSLRHDFEVPVRVNQAESVSLDDSPMDLEPGDTFVITEMSASLFNKPYFTVAQFKKEA